MNLAQFQNPVTLESRATKSVKGSSNMRDEERRGRSLRGMMVPPL